MASAESKLAQWRAHPQYSRVAAWLGTHTRIGAHLQTLRAGGHFGACATTPAQLEALESVLVPWMREELEAFELLLDAHSTLEDRKLFPFLSAVHPVEFAGAQAQFAREHATLDGSLERLAEKLAALEAALARSGISGLSDETRAASARAAAQALRAEAYALDAAMCAHLAGEEALCVELWLALDATQQAAYQAGQLTPLGPRAKL
jgi:hypothetical protein